MATSLCVLILEDRPADAELMLHALRRAGYEPDWRRVETEPDYVAHLEPTLDVILADYSLPQFDALRALQLLQERNLDIPFIVVTGTLGEEAAVECMKQGAADYLLKDRLARLGPAVAHVLDQKRLRDAKRQTEEALRESAARYRRITQAVTDYIYTVHVENGRAVETWHSAGCIAVTGYTSEDFAADPYLWHRMVVDEDRPAVENQARRVLAGEDMSPLEHRIVRKDGAERWVRNTPVPHCDGEGKLLSYDGLVQDITERKRAEDALRRRAEELAALQATVLEITAPHDLPTLLRTIVERAALLLNASGGGLYLCDPTHREVRCVVSYNTLRDYTGIVLKYGEGAAGIVAQTGQPLIVDDYRIWSGRASVYEEERPFTAVLSVPMIWQGQVTGVIHVLHTVESRRFAKADLELLTLFANHAAIAVESTRLYEAVQQELAERKQAEKVQAAIYRISEATQTAPNLEELFALIHATIGGLMPAKNFYIALYDARADLFITPYLVDEFGVPPPPYKPDKGLTAYVAWTEKPLLATPEVFEQLVQSGQVELIGRPAIDWLGAPLKTQHGTIGVMAVYTYTEAARLSEADKDVFVFVSTQVAMAVERKQAQEQIRKLNRTLQVINGANQALVRATEETELLQHICQIIVDVGGYRLAWVGLAEQDEAKTVRPVAAAGHDEGYLDTINITWADAERGRGPTGTAIRTGQPIIARNILTDPYFAPWREQAVRRGYASSIALPLLAGDRAIGALNIYATEPDAFDAEEIELLTEMAGDLAYGIVAVRTRAEHQRAEERIRRLNRDLERRARGLAALNRAGQIMASTLNLNILLERVMEQIKNLLDAEGASVLLRPSDAEKADSELVFAAVTGTAAEKLINRRVPITAGIAGWAMRERQSVLVADAQNDPRLDHSIDAITGLTTRSLLAMPLISKGSVLGVVEAINNVSGTFDQYDLEVLEALTSSAAIAIENARLFSMLNQEKRRLEFLYHLSQHLVESLDMGEVAQRALDGLRAVAGLLRGLVVVRESPSSAEISGGERDLLRMVAVSGYDAESVEALNQRLQLRVGDGLIGWVAANRQLAVIDNVTQDPRWMVVSGLDEWVRSALSVPLLSGDDLVGVLSIYSEREAFFTEDVRQLVESAAASVAIAIANARLFSTERERVTELARALEQQRELDRLQREFIQNVSHELRTPLALIRGHAEVLESSWLGELQPEQKESISVITRRAQMLGRLVDDIMSILEVERRELKQEPVDLAQLIRTSLADFQPAAQKASLTLSADIAPDLPAVSGDTIALRRALDNLVGNAFKFTPAGGRIAVHLSRSEEAVRLEVADTGIGIPSEHLGRIFERFYQVDGSMTRKYSGVGLGLALVKSIVEAHGGQITVTSQVGVGTTFTILLPNA